MYEEISNALNKNDLISAEQMIRKIRTETQQTNDMLAVLDAELKFRQEDFQNALTVIYEGLKYNYKNYELYYMLGIHLRTKNINQAYLCMENAEFYCDNEEDKRLIQKEMDTLSKSTEFSVRPVSIVILSYNIKQICIQCIESIRLNNKPETYELIVVDNASTDGIYEWLREQEDIKLIRNEENLGFSRGSNQGIKAAGENDILLLNNDTFIPPNAIFCMRMGLYEEASVGAVGCTSNCAGNGQAVYKEGYKLKDWMQYATECNVPCKNAYELKIGLGGFSFFLKHGVIERVGMLDERFSPGYYEDDDLDLKIASAGYKQLLCRNSFIIHYGSASFQNRNRELYLKRNRKKLQDKWGFDISCYNYPKEELIQMLEAPKDRQIYVLEVGCGCGTTLARIQYLYPSAIVKGIDADKRVAQIGKSNIDIISGNIESMELPYEKNFFDYIILNDTLECLENPQKALIRLKQYLKKDGCIIASISNAMHMSVIVGLLKGTVTYQKSGILDEAHLRFFTRKTAIELFEKNGFEIRRMGAITDNCCWETDGKMVEQILKLPGIAPEDSFVITQYIIKAVNKQEI